MSFYLMLLSYLFLIEFRKVINQTIQGYQKSDFISPAINKHMHLHCKIYTAVPWVTNKAYQPLVATNFFSYKPN